MKTEAPPVAEKARTSWRSGQNFSALQAEKILGPASGHAVARLPVSPQKTFLLCFLQFYICGCGGIGRRARFRF